MAQAISQLQVEGEERSMKDSFRRDLQRRQGLSRAGRTGKSVPGGVRKAEEKIQEKVMHLIRALGKSTSCVCFSPYMKRNICSFVSFKKSQHTTTGKKNPKYAHTKKQNPP